MKDKEEFHKCILEWLQKKDIEASEVKRVISDFDDWYGDTDTGFYSKLVIEIDYIKKPGYDLNISIEGKEIGDLWNHVVNYAF